MSDGSGPIGVFDSGFGGLTIFKEIEAAMPQYDYIYLGDNARTPYGTRSLEIVHRYTLEAVEFLFSKGCRLVILACNTASAMALRTIQQKDLDRFNEHNRVLGILRPTTEIIGQLTSTGHIGVFATEGTVDSGSYVIEANKFSPDVKVHQQACPLWVPLVENNEIDSIAADALVKKYVDMLLRRNEAIDSILLACTHYPLLLKSIRKHTPPHIDLITQGELVAKSLIEYLNRHPKMDALCLKNAERTFLTTGDKKTFDEQASRYFGREVKAGHVDSLS